MDDRLVHIRTDRSALDFWSRARKLSDVMDDGTLRSNGPTPNPSAGRFSAADAANTPFGRQNHPTLRAERLNSENTVAEIREVDENIGPNAAIQKENNELKKKITRLEQQMASLLQVNQTLVNSLKG